MSRKTTERKPRTTKNPTPKRVIDDPTFVAPKTKRTKHVTLAEALEESGETIEELAAPTAEAAPVRPAGTSNLANTIRSHRQNYTVALHPNGKKTQNNGDVVAQVLLHVSLDELKNISGMWFEGKRYDHLNPGHARMCIGNLLRGLANKGDSRMVEWMEAQTKRIATEVAA